MNITQERCWPQLTSTYYEDVYYGTVYDLDVYVSTVNNTNRKELAVRYSEHRNSVITIGGEFNNSDWKQLSFVKRHPDLIPFLESLLALHR